MKLGVVLAALSAVVAIGVSSRTAEAALTSSERGVVKELVAAAKPETAQKVRSLVARTDLTPDESADALGEAISAAPFNDARASFLNELVFGAASAPSRPVLVLATTKAVLARADTVYQKYVGGLDHEPKAIAELVAIYGWLDMVIANAGKPTTVAHDPNAGIPPATYGAAAKALQDHIDKNGRWLKGDGSVPATAVRLRAQAQVAFVDMLPDGLTRRVDAADRLALNGPRRKILTDYGTLVADAGKMDPVAGERVRQLFVRLPGIQRDLGLVCVEDASARSTSGAPLLARGQVVHVVPGPEAYPFDEPAPAGYDGTTSAIAHDLAVVEALRALDGRWGSLRQQADRDTVLAGSDKTKLLGHPRGPSVEYVVGAAIHALLVDAPKAVDLAASRASSGNTESIALLSDALGVLAEPVVGEGDKPGNAATKLELGKPVNASATATALRVAPNGAMLGFKLENHTWAIDRVSPSYQILSLRKDGQTIATGAMVSKAVTDKADKPTPPKKP